ncbi:hypothetical protein [Roseicyclus marinus]|uniref:hypothetical protein n=1 Tax=Roseicyclus marinus TaxID=2161673 RepID=UPI00240FB7B4|nr:hypothetical protein [Roseicyclus marinus]MDG3042361.1 hypothetical protein [Roseicyclus marinus]
MSARPGAFGYLWRHHRAALIALGLALCVALFFVVRLAVFAVYWADPAHRDQRIEGWMTPGYVARSWDLPREALQDALPDLRPGARATLAEIAQAEGVPLSEVIARMEAAIDAARAP